MNTSSRGLYGRFVRPYFLLNLWEFRAHRRLHNVAADEVKYNEGWLPTGDIDVDVCHIPEFILESVRMLYVQ